MSNQTEFDRMIDVFGGLLSANKIVYRYEIIDGDIPLLSFFMISNNIEHALHIEESKRRNENFSMYLKWRDYRYSWFTSHCWIGFDIDDIIDVSRLIVDIVKNRK